MLVRLEMTLEALWRDVRHRIQQTNRLQRISLLELESRSLDVTDV